MRLCHDGEARWDCPWVGGDNPSSLYSHRVTYIDTTTQLGLRMALSRWVAPRPEPTGRCHWAELRNPRTHTDWLQLTVAAGFTLGNTWKLKLFTQWHNYICYIFLLSFLRWCLTIWLWLVWNSLYRPGCPWTRRSACLCLCLKRARIKGVRHHVHDLFYCFSLAFCHVFACDEAQTHSLAHIQHML